MLDVVMFVVGFLVVVAAFTVLHRATASFSGGQAAAPFDFVVEHRRQFAAVQMVVLVAAVFLSR